MTVPAVGTLTTACGFVPPDFLLAIEGEFSLAIFSLRPRAGSRVRRAFGCSRKCARKYRQTHISTSDGGAHPPHRTPGVEQSAQKKSHVRQIRPSWAAYN